MLAPLRILLLLNIVVAIAAILLQTYYDPVVSPLIGKVIYTNIVETNLSKLISAFVLEILLFVTFIYSTIALWLCHRSGKWVFLSCIALTFFDNYLFGKVQIFSWLSLNANFLLFTLSGMILSLSFQGNENEQAK